MLLKNEILGIKCELSENQRETQGDEIRIVLHGRELITKKRMVCVQEPAERFAVLGEKPCYMRGCGFVSITGPTVSRQFFLRVNSRGNLHEFFIPEDDVLFLK